MGQWQVYDYDPTEWKDLLGADMIVLRGYEPQTFSQPVFFLIMQSKTETSFHPPEVCYAAQGYKIQEEGKVEVALTDATWSKGTFDPDLPFKKLVITKEAEGEITERRLVLYCYVKGNQFTTDTVTMLRISALIPIEGSYEGVLDIEKDFIDQAIPLMFDPDEEDKWNPIARELAGWGVGGYAIIALLVGIPLAILVYPRTRWGRGMK